MIKSMTAYGRAEHRLGDILFVAEIRSLNNRYRDIVLRIPKNVQPLERELKSIISSRIGRGRIEVTVQKENNVEEDQYSLELNVPLVNSYLRIFKQLSVKFGLDQDIRIESLCQMKDVILVKHEALDVEKLRPGFQEVLVKALDSLDSMRIKEGEAIESDFTKRLELLDRYADDVADRSPALTREYRKRLKENIERLMDGVPMDEARLAQEVALFAEKSDITEELLRIRSHLDQYRDCLLRDEPMGRRLDFLIQEISREVNTIGSKASDSFISRTVVEMKAELEKLREQVQNVE